MLNFYKVLFIILLSFPVIGKEVPQKINATVLLITAEQLKDAWQPFAEWKTSIGKPVKIITVKEINSSYQGRDVQEKIRLCVLNHAQKHGTRWVILGGDSEQDGKGLVPDRDSPHLVMGRLKYTNIPSDIYYISDKSWDANNDGIYGDWPNDKEEISYGNKWKTTIGRIPVRTVQEVRDYTQKVINYEKNYPAKNFARRIIYTNTVVHSEPKVTRSWDDYLSKQWPKAEAFRFFHTKTPWDNEKPGDYEISPSNWVKKINEKTAGKMHMHGHGFLPGWVLEKHQMALSSHVDKLTNKNAYLIMTTVSCFTGQFDGPKDPCITESMIRAPEKGAVIILTPAREGVPIFHSPKDFRLMVTEGKLDGTTETMTRFWMNGLKKQANGSYLTAGEAFYATKQEMAEHAFKTSGYHWCQCELNLLGDPTLDMRAANPVEATIKTSKNLKSGIKQTLKIATSIPGSLVCVWQKGTVYQTAKADDKGDVILEVPALKKGFLLISVSGANINAATLKVPIAN